jgi:hypothetical protein
MWGRARVGLARRRVEVAVGLLQRAVVAERVSPYVRAAAALVRRGHHGGGFVDASDVLLAGVLGSCAHRPEWRKAYELLQLPRLDRVTRHFGWRLVHGALRCSAASVSWCKLPSLQAMQATVCCQHCGGLRWHPAARDLVACFYAVPCGATGS